MPCLCSLKEKGSWYANIRPWFFSVPILFWRYRYFATAVCQRSLTHTVPTTVPSAHKPKSIVRSQLCLWRKMTLLLFQSDKRSSRSSFMFMSLLTQYVPSSNHLENINIIYNPVKGLHTVCLSSNPFYIGSYNIKWVKTSLSDSMSSLHIHFSFMLPCDI